MNKEEVKKYIAKAGNRVISTKEFNRELHKQHEIQRKIFIGDPKREMMPQIVVWVRGKDEKNPEKLTDSFILIAFGSGFETTDSKYKVVLGAGAKLAEQGIKFPIAAFLQSEAWMSTGMDKDKIKSGNYVQPKDDPNHKEVLITAGMTIDHRCNQAISQIEKRLLRDPMYIDYSAKHKLDGDSNLLAEFFKGYALMMYKKGEFPPHGQTN